MPWARLLSSQQAIYCGVLHYYGAHSLKQRIQLAPGITRPSPRPQSIQRLSSCIQAPYGRKLSVSAQLSQGPARVMMAA